LWVLVMSYLVSFSSACPLLLIYRMTYWFCLTIFIMPTAVQVHLHIPTMLTG
jgi:hypothetical protein